jgi:hypothetical protein
MTAEEQRRAGLRYHETASQRRNRERREASEAAEAQRREQASAALAEFDRVTAAVYHVGNPVDDAQVRGLMGWQDSGSVEQARLVEEIVRTVNRRARDPFLGLVADEAAAQFEAACRVLGVWGSR